MRFPHLSNIVPLCPRPRAERLGCPELPRGRAGFCGCEKPQGPGAAVWGGRVPGLDCGRGNGNMSNSPHGHVLSLPNLRPGDEPLGEEPEDGRRHPASGSRWLPTASVPLKPTHLSSFRGGSVVRPGGRSQPSCRGPRVYTNAPIRPQAARLLPSKKPTKIQIRFDNRTKASRPSLVLPEDVQPRMARGDVSPRLLPPHGLQYGWEAAALQRFGKRVCSQRPRLRGPCPAREFPPRGQAAQSPPVRTPSDVPGCRCTGQGRLGGEVRRNTWR